MPNGKKIRLKKPHYNLIKNLNVKTVPLTTTEPCFPEQRRSRTKSLPNFYKTAKAGGIFSRLPFLIKFIR